MLDERFGDVLLAAPRAEGWGLTAYVIPIVFFIVGIPVVIWIIRRLMRPAASAAAPSVATPAAATPGGTGGIGGMGAIDPELERQLERELGEL